MRATTICTHGKRKRKFCEDKNNNKLNLESQTEHNKENVRDTSVDIKDDHLTSSSESQPIPEKKALKFTQEIIKLIYNSVKRSVQKIGLSTKIFSSHTKRQETELQSNTLSDTHSNIAEYNEGMNNLTKIKPFVIRSYKPDVSSLPLTDTYCLIEEDFNWEKAIQPPICKIDLKYLPRYLKQKREIVRRSKTSFAPSHVVCSSSDLDDFASLIEGDPMISLFLRRDICRRYADKYLLSMVLVYFARAHLKPSDFTRENFFAALYLAHDMEEDIEEMKFEIFPFCVGTQWKKHYRYLLSVRDDLFWSLDCRAVVSRKCCEQVMGLLPDHWMWKRERPEYHGYVYESKYIDQYAHPKGPFTSPLWCRSCLERECEESDNSYIIYSSHSDISSSSEDAEETADNSKRFKVDSGFGSFLQPNEDNNDITVDLKGHISD